MNQVVLLKSQTNSRGGLEKHADLIAKEFIKRGAQVTRLSMPTAFESFWPKFWRLERFDRFVSQWLAKNPSDIVFGMDRNRYQTHLRAGNGVHAAYLQSRRQNEHSLSSRLFAINPLHRKILSLEKAAFENPFLRKLFTNSRMVRDEVLRFYQVDPQKIQVIHNGVEWTQMESAFVEWPIQKLAILHRLGLPLDSFHFLFVGHGFQRKGLEPLLEALSHLKSQDFHLSVVGKDKQIHFYQKQAERLGLQTRVHFFDNQSDVRPFYQMADCLVIPSFYDPFANVTVEALAMGLYVVSSKHNGGHEILTAENGQIIEDLQHLDSLIASLQKALQRYKTQQRAPLIRESVRHLDFSKQLTLLIDAVYES